MNNQQKITPTHKTTTTNPSFHQSTIKAKRTTYISHSNKQNNMNQNSTNS